MHTNVWGLTHISSIVVFDSYVNFMYDETRKTWVYCNLKNLMYLVIFKKWKYLFDNETRYKLSCLRLENGGEYYNKDFYSYRSYHGIHKEKIVLASPQEMVC